MTVVEAFVPAGIDDRTRPSGGNTYDRQVLDGLAAAGWTVREHAVAGSWPTPEAGDHRALAERLDVVPDGSAVLIDGLIASAAPGLVASAGRLRLVVLVHLPLTLDRSLGPGGGSPGGARRDARTDIRTTEAAVFAAAAAVITPSAWTRDAVIRLYGLDRRCVHVAEPGVAAAEAAMTSAAGGALLCVGAVTAQKGHDVLLAALAGLDVGGWSCTCVGSVEREPAFVDRLRRRATEAGIADRIRFTGALTGRPLAEAFAAADVLVHPSRGETYGLVVTEALARGLPVIASAVGGLPEALGRADDGAVPGLLVTPGAVPAWRSALGDWLSDGRLRREVTRSARARRSNLRSWAATSGDVADVIRAVAGRPL